MNQDERFNLAILLDHELPLESKIETDSAMIYCWL